MHESVIAYVGRVVRKYKIANTSKVLEMGSHDVNGSVRHHFGPDYVGIDLDDGPGVDVCMSAHDAATYFGHESFDVVVCTEMLEHDPAPWLSMLAAGRVLRDNGFLIVTTRGIGFPYHNPPDRWRFTKEGLMTLMEHADVEVLKVIDDPQVSGVFGTARRRPRQGRI